MTPTPSPGSILPFRASEMLGHLQSLAEQDSSWPVSYEQLRQAIRAQAEYYVLLNAEWAVNEEGRRDQLLADLRLPRRIQDALRQDETLTQWVDTFLAGADPWLTYSFRWIGRMLTVEVGQDYRVLQWESGQLEDAFAEISQAVEDNPEPEQLNALVFDEHRQLLAERAAQVLNYQFGIPTQLRGGRLYQHELDVAQLMDLLRFVMPECYAGGRYHPAALGEVPTGPYPTLPEGRYHVLVQAKDDIPLREPADESRR